GVLDATECPPTFNAPPGQVVGVIAGGPAALTRAVEGAEDHPEFGEQDLKALNFSPQDVFVGIATSGRTPYVLGAADYARRVGAATIGLACNTDSELAAHVDLLIQPVVGPEVLSGSTRLKAGTATKLVLNMLTTGAMVRLGKCYGNLMVDLRASNSKLRARTNRIVRILTGVDHDAADELLRRCDGELKTALVVQQASIAPEEARERLRAFGGRVGEALRVHDRRSDASSADDLVIGVDGGGTSTVALIAGTGSIAFGRTQDGTMGRSGGWGYLLGDEGSGYALVMSALQAIVHGDDGRGAKTALAERLLAAMGISQPIDLIPAVYRGGWDRTALSA